MAVHLSLAELNSRELGAVRQLLAERLAKHRTSLEGDQDERTTALLRGRIREVKEMLALLDPAPAQALTPFDNAVGMAGIAPFFNPSNDGT